MSNVVVKEFKTSNRKFKPAGPGEEPVTVTESDIQGPVSLEGWIERGFVKVDTPFTPTPIPESTLKNSFVDLPKHDGEN